MQTTFCLCLVALCAIVVTTGVCKAEGCFDAGYSATENPLFIPGTRTTLTFVPERGTAPSRLGAPTLTRLAVLSGPFQSFKDSQIQKDPKCGRWGGRDKVRHGAIFFATTLGLQLFIESSFNVSKTKAFLISAAIGTLVGVGKEMYDWKISDKDCFSEQDLVANTAGILSAGLVIMISN